MMNIPKCLTVAPHTPSPQRLLGQHMAGFHTTWREAPRHCRSFQIQSLERTKLKWALCLWKDWLLKKITSEWCKFLKLNYIMNDLSRYKEADHCDYLILFPIMSVNTEITFFLKHSKSGTGKGLWAGHINLWTVKSLFSLLTCQLDVHVGI